MSLEGPRVALVVAGRSGEGLTAARTLADGLGPSAALVGAGARELGRGLLERRGFPGELAAAPSILTALRRGRFDVIHAFSPLATAIARPAAAGSGAPLVFTATEPPRRETLADRRGKLRAVAIAYERASAFAATEEIADAAEHWLALRLEVLGADDSAGYADVYRRLIAEPVGAAQT